MKMFVFLSKKKTKKKNIWTRLVGFLTGVQKMIYTTDKMRSIPTKETQNPCSFHGANNFSLNLNGSSARFQPNTRKTRTFTQKCHFVLDEWTLSHSQLWLRYIFRQNNKYQILIARSSFMKNNTTCASASL